MKIHVHDNNNVPVKQNCLGEFELEAGKALTLHMHLGDCELCPSGHCHQGSLSLLLIAGEIFVVLEGVMPPSKITLKETQPHTPVAH